MKRVMIFSGAGLSAESGLKTFRDSGGLWEEYDVEEVCSIEGFLNDRQKVLEFYDKRRVELKNCQPNDAHKMIARIKEKYGKQVVVITQNVDDLLEKAGCKEVVHLHGFLPEIYCEHCKKVEYIGYEKMSAKERVCECGSKEFRHNIVMFGETAPFYMKLYEELEMLRNADKSMFVCIGTSGAVLDVTNFSGFASTSILNNLEESDIDYAFNKCYIEKATAAAPKIEADIDKFFS